MNDVKQILDEIRTLAKYHSVKVPIVYGDGKESEDRVIFLNELGIILSEIEIGYTEAPPKREPRARTERITDNDIAMWCVEIMLDKEFTFITTCRATARNHIRRMNEWLDYNHNDWRVELTVDKGLRFPYGARIVGTSNEDKKG